MPVTPRQAAALHASLRNARFEIIPMKGVEDQLDHLPTDAAVTVTASPTRGLDATVDLTATVAAAGHRVVPHLSARLLVDRHHVADVLARLAELGVTELFVPAGDASEPAGAYEGAADLLPVLRDLGFDGPIGITGYPESHSFIDDATTISAMAAKAPYASHIVSQICYDPAVTVGWVRAVRARGVDLPIHVGLPGVVPFAKLLKISMRVGLGDSVRFLSKQHGVAARLLAGYTPDDVVEGLASTVAGDHGVVGWHLFTFNAVAATATWWRDQLASTRAAAGPALDERATPITDAVIDDGTDAAPSVDLDDPATAPTDRVARGRTAHRQGSHA